MIKVKMECVARREETQLLQDDPTRPPVKTAIYSYQFKMSKEKAGPQRFFGQFDLSSLEPLHYKRGMEYEFTISTATDISLVKTIPKTPMTQ